MAVFEKKCFGMQCDNCKKIYENYEGFSMFVDKESVIEGAQNNEWLIDKGKCYCPNCFVIDDNDNITIKTSYEPKIARTLEDARSWASSFHTDKKETTIECPHGTAIKIDIMYKGQIVDGIIACRECWLSARDWVRVD